MVLPKRSALVALGVMALLVPFSTGASQEAARATQLEARIDAFTGADWAIHAGAGVTVPAGTYVRVGVVGGLGAGAEGLSGRADLVARFTLDPFREKRWAPYAVGGVSARFDDSSREFLVLMAGVEGPVSSGFAPAVEFGFGGGFRFGVALRQGAARRR